MSQRPHDPGSVCIFYKTPAGCKNGDVCVYYHEEPHKRLRREKLSLDGTMSETIQFPSDYVKWIIGKGGYRIKAIREEFGQKSILVEGDKTVNNQTPVILTGPKNTLKVMLTKLTEIIRYHNGDTNFIEIKLANYKNEDTEIIFIDEEPQQSASSGWGPLIDQRSVQNDRPLSMNQDSFNLNIINQIPDNLEQMTASQSPFLTTNNKILPNICEFLAHSQHMVVSDFSPAMYVHKGGMNVKAQEVVTFLNFCKCAQNCGFGCFRNAVDMIGFLPMRNISEDVLKFECPYCDEINEFYEEKEYLTHMCLIHFWRRLSSFLSPEAPFTCPLKTCNVSAPTFKDLILHYGSVPHRKVGALILDSVGERVKNLKIESSRKNSSSINEGLKQELEDTKRELENMRGTVNSMSQNGSTHSNDSSAAEIKKLKIDLREMELLKEKCNKLTSSATKAAEDNSHLKNSNKDLLHQIQNLERENESLLDTNKKLSKNVQKNLDGNLMHKTELMQKDKVIKELEAKVSSSHSNNRENQSLQNDNSVLRDLVRKLESKLGNLENQNRQLNGKCEELKSQIDTTESSFLSVDDKDALIEKLKKTIKSQKNMLHLKQQEIELIKEGMENDDF